MDDVVPTPVDDMCRIGDGIFLAALREELSTLFNRID